MHVPVLVLVPRRAWTVKAAYAAAADRLAPFDEEIEVAPYEAPCPCMDYPDNDDGMPEADCTMCGGSGRSTWTGNPEGRWDWWALGGRYGEAVAGVEKGVVRGSTYVKRLRAGVPSRLPNSILTPDGVWHDWPGWSTTQPFGPDPGEPPMMPAEAWLVRVADLVAAHPKHRVAVCDLHF